MRYSLVNLIINIIDFYSFLILISVLGSWIDPFNKSKIFQTVRKFTEPYLKLFRIIIPIGNMNLDISPVIGLFILNYILKGIILRILY
ncbi:YggT family protein [Leptotrichia sp. oral taxon 212]|jgi:hypothetical protein|uniref:YggT family protein n=1 Tax=Leptotrichia sp. oral taxon 212 TaxID=712357 RepID=UPI0006A9BE06|nr:YggT family protein [Leptotrichia sp. oral taxon 212]ALA95572.1 hypothetical protein AMK43_05590 [Leptotrichia sp. oral taxon 212]